ncbi:MAG TPA: thiamine phosphate synthase [Thermoanaerobaculia bacterium]|nr:thiamine phosphate synthase [Thermoanaerobaculia bacterium]
MNGARPGPAPPPFRLLAISQLAGLEGNAPSEHLPDSPAKAWLEELARAGIDALQLREKELSDRDLFELACRARASFPAPALLLVNGRLDVALAAGADGVHLPADGIPAAALRGRCGRSLLLGVSTHRLDEVVQARRAGADYVVFGPVYPTPGKERFGQPLGIAALRRAAEEGIAVYALGGVTLDRFGEVAAAGAAGVAGIRLFQQPPLLAEVARAAREHFGP